MADPCSIDTLLQVQSLPKRVICAARDLASNLGSCLSQESSDKVSSSWNTLMPISISSLILIIFLPTKQGIPAGAGLHVSSQNNPTGGGHNPQSGRNGELENLALRRSLLQPPMTAKWRVAEYFHLESVHSDFF